ncbi:glycerol transporter [Ceratobasidium sp. UAMH 11750]|nr:glycerol transporter [Ceratobasidium sp. UAMH 11750]
MKDARAWQGLRPLQLSLVGFWNLVVVWMKLLVPWRFFRLWALADGMDPPENMVRCMANNYSAFGFWRSWHRSYNLWVIRYIYIPLGGSAHVLRNMLAVFTFVALWHDLSFKLLAWGWLVSLFVVPEVLARSLFSPSKFGNRIWYRHLCALGGVGNILLMMGANLVGFVIGVDGMRYFMSEITGSWQGLQFLLAASACLFIAVQVMFEYREEEARRGVHRRY